MIIRLLVFFLSCDSPCVQIEKCIIIIIVIVVVGGGGGSGGFILVCRDFGRMFYHLCPTRAFFPLPEVEISSCTLIPLFMPESVDSGSAS